LSLMGRRTSEELQPLKVRGQGGFHKIHEQEEEEEEQEELEEQQEEEEQKRRSSRGEGGVGVSTMSSILRGSKG